MTGTPRQTIDFTMMYVTHDAFRRDVDRLLAAAIIGQADTAPVRAGWENFKHQLHLHHTVEDTALWPRLEMVLADRPAELALLADMEAEHKGLAPLLASVDEALAERAVALAGRAAELKDVLVEHLDHEEKAALPLIQEMLTPDDWRAFTGKMRERQGLRGAAMYVPWIVDSMPEDDRRRFLGLMPPPVRILSQTLWERRYRKLGLWAV